MLSINGAAVVCGGGSKVEREGASDVGVAGWSGWERDDRACCLMLLVVFGSVLYCVRCFANIE